MENRRIRVIRGSANVNGGRFMGAQNETQWPQKCDIFVYHVDQSSTVNDLRQYLENTNIFDVKQMRFDVTSHNDSQYKSFRILAPVDCKAALLSSENWPTNVRATEYKSRSVRNFGSQRRGGRF